MSAGSASPSLHAATTAALDTYIRAPRLEGIRTPITQRRGLMARLRQLEASFGGEKAAAAAAGVTPRTWRGWKRGTKPTAKSLAAADGAYERDLNARSQTLARRRTQARVMARDGHEADVLVEAEIQWQGYYNGQGKDGPENEEYAPYADNHHAHRHLTVGTIDIGPILLAWTKGRRAGEVLEREVSRNFGDPPIFLNTYYQGASVTIGGVQSE